MVDFTSGIIKAAVFGLIFSVVACVRGYYTVGGAEGVGRSTTRAVVVASLTILLVDFFLDEAAVLSRETGQAYPVSSEAKIRVENLRKSFGEHVVLDGINLSVGTGEALVVVGPSGTGKSVLLKHLIGLLRPDSGRVVVDGRDLWSMDHLQRVGFRKKFGMSFQEGALFDSMTRLRQHRVSAAAIGQEAGAGPRARRGVPGARAAARHRREAAVGALGRHAPARRASRGRSRTSPRSSSSTSPTPGSIRS